MKEGIGKSSKCRIIQRNGCEILHKAFSQCHTHTHPKLDTTLKQPPLTSPLQALKQMVMMREVDRGRGRAMRVCVLFFKKMSHVICHMSKSLIIMKK
jgi:hypothetical protein